MNTNYLKTFEPFVSGKVEISMPLWQVGNGEAIISFSL